MMCVLPIKNEETVKIELELVPAEFNDIRNVKSNILQTDGSYKTIYERRLNLPFWLKSFKTNEIEPTCYFLHEGHNKVDIAVFVKAGRMFISKGHKRKN